MIHDHMFHLEFWLRRWMLPTHYWQNSAFKKRTKGFTFLSKWEEQMWRRSSAAFDLLSNNKVLFLIMEWLQEMIGDCVQEKKITHKCGQSKLWWLTLFSFSFHPLSFHLLDICQTQTSLSPCCLLTYVFLSCYFCLIWLILPVFCVLGPHYL